MAKRDLFSPSSRPPKADRFDRPRRQAALGTGRPRDLLQNYDFEASWSSWRLGMQLAGQVMGSLGDQVQAATLLHSNPFTADGGLGYAQVAQVSFATKGSPEGRWTVTVLPRGMHRSQQPLTAQGQQELTVAWEQVVGGEVVTRTWRLLRVAVGPVWNQGEGVDADLVGELLEDSLLPDGGWAEDEEVRLRMVVAVDGPGDFLYLDGERQWRRATWRDARGQVVRRQLVEEPIAPTTPLALTNGRFLAQSTTLSCNCPYSLGVVLWDWRARASAIGESGGLMGLRVAAGPLMPSLSSAGVDDPALLALGRLQSVGRRFSAKEWQRHPAHGCKHCHAVRWMLGVPCAEPPDPPTPTDPYWRYPEEFRMTEEIDWPLAKPGFADALAVSGMRDAAWRDMDWMVQAVGAGDAVSAMAGVVPLPELALKASTAALSGRGRDAPLPVEVDTGERRFRAGWFPQHPRLAPYARPGDVWMGRGSEIPEPFIGPGETAGEPFLRRGWGGAQVQLLG